MSRSRFSGPVKSTGGFEVGAAASGMTAETNTTAIDSDGHLYQGGTEITASAAELNIMDGVSRTYSQINLLIQGVAAGYKVARGSRVVTGNASKATGLSTVVDFCVCARADTATKANTAVLVSGKKGSTAGNVIMYRWKHTSAGTSTLVAATTAGTVEWIAIGT